MGKYITEESLDNLELATLSSLVRQAQEGNATAASQALTAIQRIREKGAAHMHRQRMMELAVDGPGMAAYLSQLGLTREEASARLGRKLSSEEQKAWERGQEERLLEVRAIEQQRMRATGDVPKWATRRNT